MQVNFSAPSLDLKASAVCQQLSISAKELLGLIRLGRLPRAYRLSGEPIPNTGSPGRPSISDIRIPLSDVNAFRRLQQRPLRSAKQRQTLAECRAIADKILSDDQAVKHNRRPQL